MKKDIVKCKGKLVNRIIFESTSEFDNWYEENQDKINVIKLTAAKKYTLRYTEK